MTGTRVVGAYEEVVSNPARMKCLFERGNSRRQTSSHRLNAVSSRSAVSLQYDVAKYPLSFQHSSPPLFEGFCLNSATKLLPHEPCGMPSGDVPSLWLLQDWKAAQAL